MKNKNFLNEKLEQRVFFKDSNTRDEFFLEIKQKFGSWKNLGKHFGIYKSRLENFRNGSISLPHKQFLEFLKYTNKKKYANNIILKDRHWGQTKAGKITYEKHKEIFEKGRQIALKNILSKKLLDIKITPELCEFIGTFIGDGFMNKYGNKYIIQITGDYKLDKEYYEKTLTQIIKKVIPTAKPYMVKVDNTLRFTVYSKDLYKYFTEKLKLVNGKKVYLVTIPNKIINSKDYKLINSCLRGIYDTDGGVAFDRRKSYVKPYIRIVLHMKSPELIKQIYNILLKQNIKATITKNVEYIQINGTEECKKFVSKIGFSNPRHLNKIKNI
jgi:hypothetical protein